MPETQTLFCSIRKEWVAALPEEMVRQRMLVYMIEQMGFPASLIAVEQSLRLLPHLSTIDRRRVPNRRADIICFAKDLTSSAPLYPLLIVECKAIKLAPRMINQVVGYNHFIGSCFLSLANHEEIRTGWYDAEKGDYSFVNFLPSYDALVAQFLKPRLKPVQNP